MAYFPQKVVLSVSSALKRFTTVFGMGTGGTTSPKSPGSVFTCIDSLYLYHRVESAFLQDILSAASLYPVVLTGVFMDILTRIQNKAMEFKLVSIEFR